MTLKMYENYHQYYKTILILRDGITILFILEFHIAVKTIISIYGSDLHSNSSASLSISAVHVYVGNIRMKEIKETTKSYS